MSLAYLIAVFFGLAAFLAVAELLLPTHGLLGILALVCAAGGIVACFYVNQWLGLGVFLGSAAATPFLAAAAIKLWPRTPVGKRLLLPDVKSTVRPLPVAIGQIGIVVTPLRPMGECDFGDTRVEALAEYGIIEAGERVRVVALGDNRVTVRPAASTVVEAADRI
jgi:membrane-bound ClpP family serine protease